MSHLEAPAVAPLGHMVAAQFVPDERARRLYWRLAEQGPTARFGVYGLWAPAARTGSRTAGSRWRGDPAE